jgi:hypothetical protein
MAHINGSERDVSDDEPEDDDGEDAGGGPVESRED